MKKYILLLLLTSMPTYAFYNEPDGFRDIKWGSMIDNHKSELTYVYSRDNKKYYLRKNDKLEIGGAKLKSIKYLFIDDKFSSVIISTEGLENQTPLIDALNTQFGEGFKANRYIESYLWSGDTSIIFISCKSIYNSCMATIQSKISYDEQKEDKKLKAESSSKDF